MQGAFKAIVAEGDYREVRIDPSTHSLQTVAYDHHETHNGKMFSVQLSTSDMGALTTPEDTLHFNWTVGAGTADMHLLWQASCGGLGNLIATVNPTGGLASPEGTKAPSNHHLGSTNVSSTALVYYNATAPTGGTVARDEWFGVTGIGGRVSAGESRGLHERILTPGTIISLQLVCTENVYGNLEIIWYEHTAKETVS